MGRHSNGKNNYSLSGGAIAALCAVLALTGGVVWSVSQRGDESETTAQEKPCVLGELALPVATSNEQIAQELIGAYAASKPVVREHCILPVITDKIADAAVYLAPATSITQEELSRAQRSSAVAEPAVVYVDQVGVAGKGEVSLNNVRFPTNTPEANAVVAFLLADGPAQAVHALTEQAVDGEALADGLTVASASQKAEDFQALDGAVEYAAIPLNSTNTVDENQARAGQDFARFAAERVSAAGVSQPLIPETVWAAALPDGGAALTSEGRNTLFVLDTSDAMTPFMAQAQEAVGQAARDVQADGHEVALWNYSSPLSPGVMQGYRHNVDMTPDAEYIADVVGRLGTAGVPQTREAVSAAVAEMSQREEPVRVVLITTGTADANGDPAADEAFVNQIRQLAGDKVEVIGVHVGTQEPDAAVKEVASTWIEAENLPQAVREAAGA